MSKLQVFCIAKSHSQAEQIVERLQNSGYPADEISGLVDALVRRLTLQAASLATLANAVPGRDMAVIANTNRADSNALMSRLGRGERRPGRMD